MPFSSPPFGSFLADASPPGPRRQSKFTYKHLNQLAAFSTTTPLRTIAHIDLDAFYAQCEMVRLGVADDQPLAVQQWQALIAVNYPARNFGVGRHITASEAKKLCPNIKLQHVATWREGDEKWAYRENSADVATHKVSLDPYRIESRKILSLIRETLPPAPVQRIEKAGIDEVFVDLSAQVHSILLQRFPHLQRSADDDSKDNLPWPPLTIIEWATDSLVDLESDEFEIEDPDWDDVCISIAAEIVRDIRAKIRQRLRYTCSAGIGRNKMLSKLGSGYSKPNKQTVIRSRAIQSFLCEFKVTKIRNLGGKLGDEVVSLFQTDSVKDLLKVSHDQWKKLGDGPGTWVYETIRGTDTSEVNPRTEIKSMLSAKSFRPLINSLEQATKWLRIFIADLHGRCVDEGVLENKRRPKTIPLTHRQGGQSKSKRCSIPLAGAITEGVLFELAKNLLVQIVAEGRAWPCSHLSVNVIGFEDAVSGNMGIDDFILTGNGSRVLTNNCESGNASDVEYRVEKRKRHYFPVDDSEISGGDPSKPWERLAVDASNQQQQMFRCDRCKKELANEVRMEHEDWHYAKQLEYQLRHEVARVESGPQKQKSQKASKADKKQSSRNSVPLSKGQQQLTFHK
jgi:DNA polymerase eta